MSLTLLMLAVGLLAREPEGGQGRPAPAETPSPAEAARCAGLTQAASELNAEGPDAARTRRLYDAGLYWSLAAMQAAKAAGQSTEAAEAAQTRRRAQALAELRAGGAEARDELARCLARTPSLD